MIDFVRQLEFENAIATLNIEKSTAQWDVQTRFRKIRAQLLFERNTKLDDIKKRYHQAIDANKYYRRRLWVDKQLIDKTSPVDAEALADNLETCDKLHREARLLSEQYGLDIQNVKQEFHNKKLEALNLEQQELMGIERDFKNKRVRLLANFTEKGGEE